jgi:aflatoxin B1 aldehyde reductase
MRLDWLVLTVSPQVNTLYLHWPDRETPFLSVLRDLHELHQEGKYETLGISNFSADEVDQMCSVSFPVSKWAIQVH